MHELWKDFKEGGEDAKGTVIKPEVPAQYIADPYCTLHKLGATLTEKSTIIHSMSEHYCMVLNYFETKKSFKLSVNVVQSI